jgi:hypothetical protein
MSALTRLQLFDASDTVLPPEWQAEMKGHTKVQEFISGPVQQRAKEQANRSPVQIIQVNSVDESLLLLE